MTPRVPDTNRRLRGRAPATLGLLLFEEMVPEVGT